MSPAEITASIPVIVTPPEVFDAVNELLIRVKPSVTDGQRILYQEEIVRIARNKLTGGEVPVDFKFEWLNFEEAYRAKGWDVVYDKPTFADHYKAFFTFTPIGGVVEKRARQ